MTKPTPAPAAEMALREALQYAVDILTPGRTDGPTHHHVDMFMRKASAALAGSAGPGVATKGCYPDEESSKNAFITAYRLWVAETTPNAHPEMVDSMSRSHWQRAAGAMWKAALASKMTCRMPSDWVPLNITFEGEHPEEVAYGPQIMMDRLKKWLDKFYAYRIAERNAAAAVPALATTNWKSCADQRPPEGVQLIWRWKNDIGTGYYDSEEAYGWRDRQWMLSSDLLVDELRDGDLDGEAITFDAAWDAVDWNLWRSQPIRELVRHLYTATYPQGVSRDAGVRDAALEEVAKWYAENGWLLDEEDVPGSIRALKSTAPAVRKEG